MEDDRNRLTNPLKLGWNLLLEGILENDDQSALLEENHQVIHQSFDELNKHLHSLSRYRHTLNCQLEAIKRDVEHLQLELQNLEPEPRDSVKEQAILRLQENGYNLQVELEMVESQLKKIRSQANNAPVSEKEPLA
ncbi:MAG: hypothetical protein RJB66_768 [Pseudomonadota bacterium]|jgi:chromosome segregation ATPase